MIKWVGFGTLQLRCCGFGSLPICNSVLFRSVSSATPKAANSFTGF